MVGAASCSQSSHKRTHELSRTHKLTRAHNPSRVHSQARTHPRTPNARTRARSHKPAHINTLAGPLALQTTCGPDGPATAQPSKQQAGPLARQIGPVCLPSGQRPAIMRPRSMNKAGASALCTVENILQIPLGWKATIPHLFSLTSDEAA